MRKRTLLLALSALLAASPEVALAEEGRFDAQVFRPAAAPRDLVMVQKSEVIGNLSPTVGLYSDIAADPLVLLVAGEDTNQAVNAISSRLELAFLAGIGFFDVFDVTMTMPLILFQEGGNLRRFGTEGSVKSNTVGDLRFSTKVSLPYLNRKEQVKEGFGMAVAGNLNFPTGDQNAFASDGALSGGATLIADYRFNFGLLLAANAGIWLRPENQFAGVRVGDMAQFGIAAEQYVVQRWGLSVLGNVYGYPSLSSYPDDPGQIPAEALLGLRWQTKHGVTITFGAACGFGAPSIRFFNVITWQPKTSQEQEEINRLQQQDNDDPDRDGLIGAADRCPDIPGSPENFGCPDLDTDGDGFFDRDDQCPDKPAGPHGKNGCPIAFIRGDEIVITEQVHFATDRDIILEDSNPTLEAVAQVLIDNPEIREVRIEGHTDVRASDVYNLALSQRRVASVMAYLIAKGVDPSRLQAKGYGHTQPIYDDTGCTGPDAQLSADCQFMTSKNRRVVFRILRYGAAGPKPLSGVPEGSGPVLPSGGVLPQKSTGTLPTQGTLPNQGVLRSNVLPGSEPTLPSAGTAPGGVAPLPNRGDAGGLPSNKSVLPRSGAPAPAPSTSAQPPAPPAAPPPGQAPTAPQKKGPAPAPAPGGTRP
ncbi:outer membrane protein [Sorangium cellulosum]|uniref:Outer membrane protein n=1 Tax=Sorangium cellulosum TaxID=56 RepID=A0A2L0ETU9_SORCE|nr:OmpA family protein [Sorangium cellulosum]AUX42723.1 outer membrane protein [Sorangium cellulosum]QAT78200.1 TraB [Sorangium cellulosum]